MDHCLEARSGQTCASNWARWQSLGQKSLGQGVVFGLPTLANIERLSEINDSPGNRLQLGFAELPTCHRGQNLTTIGIEMLERSTDEFAENQGIDQRRTILGLDRACRGMLIAMESVGVFREVDLIGPTSVVIGTARPDRQPQCKRLYGARLIAGQLEPFHLGCKVDRVLPDRLCQAARPFCQCVAQIPTKGDVIEPTQHRLGLTEVRPTLEQAPLATLHGERQGPARGNRVDSELVASLEGEVETATNALNDALWGNDLDAGVAALSAGANVNGLGDDKLICAAAHAGHLDMVRLLVENGADVNAEDAAGISALGKACGGCHEDMAKYLLDKGAKVTSTVMMAAGIHQHPGIMALLEG